MTIQYSMEWNEILGDMVDDVREDQSRIDVHEAIAAEQELSSQDLDDWYQQLLTKDNS